MNTKTMATLGLVTAGLLAVGFYVAQRGPNGSTRADSSNTVGQLLFPELKQRLGDVAALEIVGATATVKLAKVGSTWGVADKGGYPVDFGKVKQAIVGLSEMDVVAAMTSNPTGHTKLGLTEPTEAEATSKRLTVKDANGAVLADVIVGNTKPHQGFGGKGSLYVRKAGDPQCFEVHGQMNVAADLKNWLQLEVAKLESARVQRVRIQHPDGNVLTISKSAAADKNFSVEGLPEGAELSWPGVADGVAGALQYMNLDDVQTREGFDPSGGVTAEFECFDGMRVTAVTVERDEKTWLTLEARLDESLRAAPVGPPAPAVEGEPAPETPAVPELRPVEEVTKEIDELNAKWSRWVYAVPGYSASNLRKKMADLLKQDNPAGAGAEGDGGELDLNDVDLGGIDLEALRQQATDANVADTPVSNDPPQQPPPSDTPADKPADKPTDG